MQSTFDLSTSVTNLLPKDGEIYLHPNAIDADVEELLTELELKHEKIRLFGRWILQPRLSAWYGDEGTDYVYSGLLNKPKAWTYNLALIKRRVETLSKAKFNSVLVNYYRNGQDGMGWHQDNEPELGEKPVIASVSIGETRRFQLRHKYDKRFKTRSIELVHGCLLIMQGETQNFWQHQVPKTQREVGGRINLTFRQIQT